VRPRPRRGVFLPEPALASDSANYWTNVHSAGTGRLGPLETLRSEPRLSLDRDLFALKVDFHTVHTVHVAERLIDRLKGGASCP
jgi:hypothetical protein